jgi:hypothetical protein
MRIQKAPKPVLRIRDVYPGSWFLPIPNPGSRISEPGSKNSNKRERWKKLDVKPVYVATKFNKIVNYFSFDVLKKKIWANFQRIIELFTKKIVKKLFKIWSWDPGSEIRDPEKTHSGSRIQGSKRHRIRIRNTAQNIRILWIWKPELKEFILFFIYDGMIRMRIRMRIREAQKTYGFWSTRCGWESPTLLELKLILEWR